MLTSAIAHAYASWRTSRRLWTLIELAVLLRGGGEQSDQQCDAV